jgi:hypothetical protein
MTPIIHSISLPVTDTPSLIVRPAKWRIGRPKAPVIRLNYICLSFCNPNVSIASGKRFCMPRPTRRASRIFVTLNCSSLPKEPSSSSRPVPPGQSCLTLLRSGTTDSILSLFRANHRPRIRLLKPVLRRPGERDLCFSRPAPRCIRHHRRRGSGVSLATMLP